MSLPNEPEDGASTRFCTLCAVGLLIVAAIATAASWRLYPAFIDTYYHMAVIEGFSQAGGVTTRAFWEMAPAGRVHIYPPSLHVIGYFFELLGVSPGTFMTWVSGTFYVLCLLTTWIWLRRIIGERSALFALALLCGPSAFWWNQATFQAVAGVLVLAPLALLALETRHFVACGVLNFVAITMHPMGLFLPPALAINALLRRQKIVAGWLAASVPVVLYSPWLAHIWANRALLPDKRTGGEISLDGPGGGANLGLFLIVTAALAIPWLIKRRGPALGLIGALLGFAVVFPMGFGSRFLSLMIHWPLAGLGGFGLGEFVRWLGQGVSCRWWEKHFGSGPGEVARRFGRCVSLRPVADLLSIVVAAIALLTYPAFTLPLGGPGGPGGPGWPGGFGGPGGPTGTQNLQAQLRRMFTEWQFTVQTSSLPKLFDAYSGMGGGMGMGMGPGGGPGMGFGGPGMMFGGPWRGVGGPVMGPAAPGAGPGAQGAGPGGRDMGQGMAARGQRGGAGTTVGAMSQMPSGRQARQGMGGGPGMFGMNVLRRADAQEFFEAVRTNVVLGDVIHIDDGATGNLIAGATGRWTSSGILRDVRSENGRTKPQECDFVAVVSGGMGMPGPGGGMGSRNPPSTFEKVFENDYGTLYRNPAKVEHEREPLKADVSLPFLVVIAIVGFLLVLVDFLPVGRAIGRPIAAMVGTIVVALCLLPLTSTALDELRDPPTAPPREEGPPGFGGPGFGGPGFGGPGFGPGQFLAQTFLQEADTDKNNAVSLEELKALAGRWFKNWDLDRSGDLGLDEVSQGISSIFLPPNFGPPPGAGGGMPFPGGPPPMQ